jgi:hypothetical protein
MLLALWISRMIMIQLVRIRSDLPPYVLLDLKWLLERVP